MGREQDVKSVGIKFKFFRRFEKIPGNQLIQWVSLKKILVARLGQKK
jgi:hypothetical protein